MAHRRFITAVGSGLLVALLYGTAFAAGPHAYITLPWRDAVALIDTDSQTVVNEIETGVGTLPSGVATTPSRVYIANSGSNTVSVIDVATNTVAATIGVGVRPFGIAADAEGTYVYVANQGSNSVSVIDAATNSVVATVLEVGTQPVGVAVHPAGTKIFVTGQTSGSLAVIDAATRSVQHFVTIGSNVAGVAVSPDGTRVWVPYQNGTSARLAVFDPETNQLTWTPLERQFPFGVAVDPQGSRVYVGHSGGTVSVIDAATGTPVSLIEGVGWGAFGLTVHPTAPQLWVAAEDMWHVTVVDTGSLSVTKTIAVDEGPVAFGSFIPAPAQEGCNDGLHAAVENALGKVEAAMRRAFHDDFSVPGSTTAARLGRLTQGVKGLTRGHLTGVHDNLLSSRVPAMAEPEMCDENLKAAVQQTLQTIETALQQIDRKFQLHGDGLVSRLNKVADAVARLNHGRLQGLYWNLR